MFYNAVLYISAIHILGSFLFFFFQISLCAELESEDNGPSPLIGIEHIFETNELCIASSSGEIFVFDISSKEVSNLNAIFSYLVYY